MAADRFYDIVAISRNSIHIYISRYSAQLIELSNAEYQKQQTDRRIIGYYLFKIVINEFICFNKIVFNVFISKLHDDLKNYANIIDLTDADNSKILKINLKKHFLFHYLNLKMH